MVISRLAIRTFLDRKLRDSRKAKRFTESALTKKCRDLIFTTKPYKHQRVCTLLGMKYDQYLFFLDMGLGKTKIILDIFQNRKQKIKPLLVLVPNTMNVVTWEEEIAIHAPNLSVAALTPEVARAEREELVQAGRDVLIITYLGFLAMVTEPKPGKKAKDPDKGWQISEKKIREFCRRFGMVAYDESTVMRTHNSLLTRACRKIGSWVECRYALTGTPFGSDPSHLWSQFSVIDRGETLGSTLGLFRSAFFNEVDDYWAGSVFVFDNKMTDDLHRMLRNRSIRYEESECGDMPKLLMARRYVTFPEETWTYYNNLVEELTEAKGNYRAVDSAFTRMRQLSSGFLGTVDPEGEKGYITFKENPKLEALIEMVKEVPEGDKILIFNDFIKTGDLICERLTKEKITHARVFGKTKRKANELKKFKTDPKCRVMVINSASGAYGLNLQIANWVFVFESPLDPIVRRQMIKRAHRGGQTKKVHVYDIVVKKSADVRILDSIEANRNLFDEIIEGRERVRKRIKRRKVA